MKKKTILYLISDTGGGHRASARALLNTISRMAGEGTFHQEIVDVFTKGSWLINFIFGKTYGPMIQWWPGLYRQLYYLFNRTFLFQLAIRINYPFIGANIGEMVKELAPHVIVSIHPLANHLIVRSLRDVGLRGAIPVVTVVTDPVTMHLSWVEPGVDRLVVATEVAKKAAMGYGMLEEKIVVIGLPIDPRFLDETQSKAEILQSLSLQKERMTLLLMGGGEGAGKLGDFAKALGNSKLPIQLIVVAGRNKRLETELREFSKRVKIPMVVFGYTLEVPTLMTGADLLISKAGPGTIAEAMSKNLPVLITSFVPGQEEGNVKWIEEQHVGTLITNPRHIVASLEQIIKNDTVKVWRQNVERIKQPRASFEIAHLILSMMGK